MRLLVLGGTGFVGRAAIEAAVARGWSVTALNRGRRPAPTGARAVVGDRRSADGLAGLWPGDGKDGDDEWDAVIDTWSAEPSVVRDSAAALADRVGRYVYVSSRSVYVYPPPLGHGEDAPVVDASPDDGADVDYARAKRGAELAALAAFGDRTLFARAGLILGPYEDIGRLPWWLGRIARGGDVLAPGPKDLPLQYIDVRDLATWMLDAAETGLAGPYDLVSPSGHASMDAILAACVRATGSTARLRWTDPETIRNAGIQAWTQLPIWLPPGPDHDGFHRSDVSRAVAAGLRCRPVEETVADTWAWIQEVGPPPLRPDRPPSGLDPEIEARVLSTVDG